MCVTLNFALVVVEFKEVYFQELAFPGARSWHWKEGGDTAAEHVLPADAGRKENVKPGRMLQTIICRNTSEGAYKELSLSDFPSSLLFGTGVGNSAPVGPTVFTQLTTCIWKLQMDS